MLPHPFSCHAAAHAFARAGDSDCAMVKGEPYNTIYLIHSLLSGHFQQKKIENIFNSLLFVLLAVVKLRDTSFNESLGLTEYILVLFYMLGCNGWV